jgi:hypothetical protein
MNPNKTHLQTTMDFKILSTIQTKTIGFLIDDDYENSNNEISKYNINVQLQKEKIDFLKMIENKAFFNTSTASFWFIHRKSLPNLSKLASKLMNIPASSSFIERYYSLCGAICSQRQSRLKPETIINRCILKTNLTLLNDFNNE